MKSKIFINQWLLLKPYKKHIITDSYYLKLSNDVKKTFEKGTESFLINRFLDKNEIEILSVFLVSYLEDLVSDTNIWNTFIKKHKEIYKKPLPFYEFDEYFEKEINYQDVCFLIWYFLNCYQKNNFISPYNEFIFKSAEKVMEIFEANWEFAPENEFLKTFYELDDKENDFYVNRKLIDTILFETYLFFPDTGLKFREDELKIINKNKNDKNITMYLNENRDHTLHKIHTSLLSLRGKEWASEIIGRKHALSNSFKNMSQKITGFFFYKGQDPKNVFIEHIASGKQFKMTKKSIDTISTSTKIDSILYIGIAQWRGEWWFSGIFTQQQFKAELILDEKNSNTSRNAVNFLAEEKKKIKENLELQFKAFLSFNEGNEIAFMPTKKIESFIESFYAFFNNSLQLTEKEFEESKQRIKNDSFFVKDDKNEFFKDFSETGLVFFNPKSGIEVVLKANSAFPLPNNPYFKSDESEEAIFLLLVSDSVSLELANYCIKNCRKNLPFFKKGLGKAYLKDIDFLMRFWKREFYHTTSSMTMIGKE